MKAIYSATMLSAALVAGAIGTAVGGVKQVKADSGESEYRNNCAVCHGADGKSGLQIMDLMDKAPPDLTTMSKRNNGVFPVERVYGIIDGREAIKAHGGRDMPAWGDRYAANTENARAADYYVDVPYDMDMYARVRITSLVEYLRGIQVK